MLDHAHEYAMVGFALCAIKPGSKQPRGAGWQKQPRQAQWWESHPSDGIGIIHHYSGTCALDIDDLDAAREALAAIDVDIDAELNRGVQIVSREGRAKLLYAAPPGLPDKRHALNWRDGNGTQYCVVEFRAGLVQDVLPPSTHPDTGEPYRWGGGGDWRELPELPDVLARAWGEWDIAKEAMQEPCPHISAPTRVPKNTTTKRYDTTSGGGVIEAFNAAHDIDAILQAHGYARVGKRWRSPHSKSKIPGVVLLPDSDPPLIYCHHASDSLCDGHAHDAFSLYCQLEHDGDVTRAVREAAQALGIEREQDQEGARLAKRVLEGGKSKRDNVVSIPPNTVASPDPEPLPDPGPMPVRMAREVERWLCNQLHAAKQDALRQSTLSYLSFLASRRYVTPDQQPVTTFFAATDSSVAGLRPAKGALYSLAAQCGERKALRGTQIPSAGILYAALLRCPRMYWVTDEYGHMVTMARRQQSGALESAVSVLHECYSGHTLYIDPDTARQGHKERHIQDCDIYHPAVTLMAMLSYDQVAALAKRSEYGRGTLQQTLCIEAGEAVTEHRPDYAPAGDELIEWCKRIASVPGIAGAEQAATIMPQMTAVPIDSAAENELSRVRDRMIEYMREDQRQPWRGMVHGYMQSARRVACSLAAWDNPDTPCVSAEIARWAGTWALRCLMSVVPRIEVSATDGSDEPDVMQRVQELLHDNRHALTAREIARRCRAFRRLSGEDREAMLAQMVEDGLLSAQKTTQSIKYVAAR